MSTNVTPKMMGGPVIYTLTDGTAQSIEGKHLPIPATVWARPAAGDTVSVEYSLDGGSNYEDWPNGDVTAFASDTLISGVTNIRFTRSAGTGTTSTVGVC